MSIIKNLIPSLAAPLAHVFSCSLMTGVVLSHLKIAKIVPIFKSGDRQSMDNYRPISLLSNFSKILEKIVATNLTIFSKLIPYSASISLDLERLTLPFTPLLNL